MSTDPSTAKLTPAELEADIARQREELATTVNELTEQVQVRARTAARRAAVAAGVAAVLAVAYLVIKRSRT